MSSKQHNHQYIWKKNTQKGKEMAQESAAITDLVVEGVVLHPFVKAPCCTKTLFLGAAGERSIDENGVFVVYTVHGFYLHDSAVSSLAPKWKGKTAEELAASLDFYLDIVKGPFEKLSMVTLTKPLTGEQFSGKVAENCIAIWKHKGIDVDAEASTIQKFLDIFKPQMHPPSSKIFFTFHAFGAVTIAFSKDGTTPESGEVIESRALSEAILESIIGEHGVSPAAKRCLAERMSKLLEKF